MHIEQVDPRDAAAFEAWFAVVQAAEQHARPGETGTQLDELRASAVDGLGPDDDGELPPVRRELVVARAGELVVGAGRLDLPQRENRHLAELTVVVDPDRRRAGIGTALLVELTGRAARHGRRVHVVEVEESPAQEGDSPGGGFAVRHGFTCGLTEVRRDLHLPLDPQRVAALEQTCRQYAAGYAVRTWVDRCPDDLVEDRVWLGRRMSTDAPVGDLPYEEEDWDVARFRRSERLATAQGNTLFAAGAVELATGRMIAFSQVGLPQSAPDRAYQWETLVLAEHRGRRLGALVKLACTGLLTDASPATRLVSTWNAVTNTPMIAVNEALGYRPNGTWAGWQRTAHERPAD